jgi:hypothetical protein
MPRISILFTLLILAGCASVAGQKKQAIVVQTVHDNVEIANIACTLTNDAGSWYLTTPGSAMVHKSTGDLVIDCKNQNFHGNQTIVSKSNNVVWGNVLMGGGVGYIVDRKTGAGFDYPASTTISLRKTGNVEAYTNKPTAAAGTIQ